MNGLAHSTNVRRGKTPVTKLDPTHSRKAGTAQAWRQLSHRRNRRLERYYLKEAMERARR